MATKKYSTLRAKLREKMKADKPIRTYKRREPGEEKTVYTVSKETYLKRHEFCFNAWDIQQQLRVPGAQGLFERRPQDFAPSCNHPEDGLCIHRTPTDDELKQINDNLGGIINTVNNTNSDLEKPIKEFKPLRRRRRKSGDKPPLKYFCLSCQEFHNELDPKYSKHSQFKRGRGRPKK